MSEAKFFQCEHCGNMFVAIVDKKVPPHCCGEKMVLLNPNTVDAAVEKHVPTLDFSDGKVRVCVGEVIHPMTEEHLINWIAFVTFDRIVVKHLAANSEPCAVFCMHEHEDATVYAYCNLHGLWKAEISA